jgi:hypothetical protein
VKEYEINRNNMKQSEIISYICLGFGLGYLPLALAKAAPQLKLILIEPDPARLTLAFRYLDWTPLLAHPGLALLIGASIQTVIGALNQLIPDLSAARIFAQPAQTAHAAAYFADLSELIRRNTEKQAINQRTLTKYEALWRRNTRRNLHLLATLPGVDTLPKNSVKSAIVVAAGPTLEALLPKITALCANTERPLIIAVDTALRSLLTAGIEPDYVVVADAQYWNARHLASLAAPRATLVTEIAVCPSVFRFPCARILLYDSANPVTRALCEGQPPKGALAAGGSVASVAWDLARRLGATDIYLAGLDLAFPRKRTHARGSLFERQSHQRSSRLTPQETASVSALFSAPNVPAQDYAGRPLLTDQRMRLYAWWFESTIAAHPEVRTWSLSTESLAIPGVRVALKIPLPSA